MHEQQADLFGEPMLDETGELLRRVHRRQKISQRDESILIAHGLIYDPHVDGWLRLTPPGRERIGL